MIVLGSARVSLRVDGLGGQVTFTPGLPASEVPFAFGPVTAAATTDVPQVSTTGGNDLLLVTFDLTLGGFAGEFTDLLAAIGASVTA